MEIDKETQEKIQELQSLEQMLHTILMQKQAFQLELNESENALLEISQTSEDIFKLVGNILIKADKKNVEEELKRKKELLALRLKSLDSQEKEISGNLDELKEEVMKKIK